LTDAFQQVVHLHMVIAENHLDEQALAAPNDSRLAPALKLPHE
jgi:hypothetical protein